MKLEIWQDEARTGEVALEDGESTVGGEGAKIVLPGETGIQARLWVESGRLSVDAERPLRVGGLQLPARMRRLVIPGERIELGAFTLLPVGLNDAEQPATRALAFDLLGGVGEVETPVHLTCVTGADAGRRFAIGDVALEIGRGDGAAIRLRDRAVSRRHARVMREGEQYLLEELGAPNGVYVNGARVRGRAVLAGGELIEIGQSLLRFTAPPPPKPAAEGASRAEGTGEHRSDEAATAQKGSPQESPGDPAQGQAQPGAPEAVQLDAEAGLSADGPRATDPIPHRRGEWLLIALGVLVFGAGLIVSASCLAGSPFPGWFSHPPASASSTRVTAKPSQPTPNASHSSRPTRRRAASRH